MPPGLTGLCEALPGSTRALFLGSSDAAKSCHGPWATIFYNTITKVALARNSRYQGPKREGELRKAETERKKEKTQRKYEAERSLDSKTRKASEEGKKKKKEKMRNKNNIERDTKRRETEVTRYKKGAHAREQERRKEERWERK